MKHRVGSADGVIGCLGLKLNRARHAREALP